MTRSILLLSLIGVVACGSDDAKESPGAAGAGGTAGSAGAGGGATGGSSGSGTGGAATGGSGGAAGSGSGGQGGGPGCLASDTMMWAGTAYTEAQSTTDPTVCDPQIMAAAYKDLAGSGAPGINVLLHMDWNSSGKVFGSFVSMNLNGTATGSYSYGIGAMESSVIWKRTTGQCIAGSGSVTLTQYDGIGGIAAGTFSFGAFTAAGGATCPTSVDGSFSTSVVDGDLFSP